MINTKNLKLETYYLNRNDNYSYILFEVHVNILIQEDSLPLFKNF